MGDAAADDAELIVESAAVVAGMELECVAHEVGIGLELAAFAWHELGEAFSRAAAVCEAAMGPMSVLAGQIAAEEAEHVAAWDDEIGY